jgi:hypothetical protein
MPRSLLALEFLLLFVALPLAYRFSPVRIPALPLLWLVTAYAAWQLLRDPQFSRTRLWNATPLAPTLPQFWPYSQPPHSCFGSVYTASRHSLSGASRPAILASGLL